MTRQNALRDQILKAKHAYYNSGEPIMSDAEYDALEDELRLLAPDDPVLALVGSPVSLNAMLTKARHAMPMGSQSKVNSEAEFRTWCAKNGIGYIHASLKGDGASAAAYYRNGHLVQAISRGDGTVGEDITANALRFKGLPVWAGGSLGGSSEGTNGGFTGSVRFEVILTVDDWTAIDPARTKNPRNAGNGIMGRKNGHQSDCLTIFAFDIDETSDGASVRFSSETEKSARLTDLGFNVIPHRCCADADEAVGYFQDTAGGRDALPFWIDGMVMKVDDITRQAALGVTSGRPKGQVAWKFDSSGAETVLEEVVISGGHTGGLYPTAQLRPVEIGGTTVSNASLAHFDEIDRLDVAIGDSVWVVKANDIIPKIIRVTERPLGRRPILAPMACPFCGGQVGRRRTTAGDEGVMIECRNADCPKKSSGKIRRWIASVDILGIGDSVLAAMLERFALEDAAGLYTLRDRADELADLVINADRDIRLGEKRALSILDAIDATRSLTLSQFLGSLGLDHLGKRRVELMIKAAGGALNALDDWQSGRLRDAAFAAQAGVPNIGGPIQDGIDAMAQVIDRLLAAGVAVLPPQDDILESANGEGAPPLKTICISGKLPSGRKKADYAAPLRAAGYELVDEVINGLTCLVLAEPGSTSGKAEKVRRLGVAVVSEEQLMQLIEAFADEPPAQPGQPAILDAPVQHHVAPPRKEPPVSTTKKIPTSPGQVRRFEFVDGKSSKFWEIRVTPEGVEVRYGRIGTAGQTQLKAFDDASMALQSAEKQVAEKLKGGYVEHGSATLPAPNPTSVVAKAAPSKTAPPTEKHAKVNKAVKAATATPTPPPPQPRRPAAPVAAGTVVSKSLCISGKLPSGRMKSDYETPLRAAGITLVDDVIKGLTYLVLADPASASAKADKARKMGVEVISEERLTALLQLSDDGDREASEQLMQALADEELSAESPEAANQATLRTLQAFAKKQEYAENRIYIDEYSKNSLPYCVPRFLEFDKRKREHRLDDQAIRGFPFTSANWLWPRTTEGKPMQPLAQINLARAGQNLGADLGDGLLQVWMDPHPFGGSWTPTLRIIPASVLNDTLDPYFPDDAVWNTESDDMDDDICTFYLYLSQMRHPRIEWVAAGNLYPNPLQAMADWCHRNTKFSERRQEQLCERLIALGIPMPETRADKIGRIHLGGYPRGYGNEGARCDWSGKRERLLLYISPDNGSGVFFTIQVTFKFEADGKVAFRAFITSDR